MRKPVIAGNWKMYKLIAESVQTAADRLEGSNIHVAGQDCSTESKHGAHTGEVAADMLKDAGASQVIVGHSERRHYYSETDAMVNHKVQAGLAADLTVIFCVSDTLEQRESV